MHPHTHAPTHMHAHAPTTTTACRYVEYVGLNVLYDRYRKEATTTKDRVLSKSYFHTLWLKTMRKGVTDPASAVHFNTFVRTNKARGFAKCNTCETLKAKIMYANNKTHRASYMKMLDIHYAEVNADREELARFARCLLVPPSFACFARSMLHPLLTLTRALVCVGVDSAPLTKHTLDFTSTRLIPRNLESQRRPHKRSVWRVCLGLSKSLPVCNFSMTTGCSFSEPCPM